LDGLPDRDPRIVKETGDVGHLAVALLEVVVDLPQVVPVLDHCRIHALREDVLVEALAYVEDGRIVGELRHRHANVSVHDVTEEVVVGRGVEVVVLRKQVQQVLLVSVKGCL